MKRRLIPWSLALVLLTLALSLVCVSGSARIAPVAADRPRLEPAAALVVTSAADSGQGTLRQALLDAAGGDTITFDPLVFPPDSPVAIVLASPLPAISVGNLTIDASSAGVALLGSGLSSGDGLQLASDGNVVKGLGIALFPGSGILISNAAHNTIGGTNYTPGTGCGGDCNVIGGNQGDGVVIEGSASTGNRITGNVVGLGADGMTAQGNGGHGIALYTGAHDNTIGGASPGERNVISANGASGVGINHVGTSGNVVAGNYIGTDAGGTTAIGNAVGGVTIGGGSSENIVGADDAPRGEGCSDACNLVSGNGDYGIYIVNPGSEHNVIRGNFVGTDATGSYAIPNLQEGISLWDGASDNWIQNNLVSGNGDNGISLTDGTSSITITGNYIGVDASGTFSIPNGYCGVLLRGGVTDNVLGGDTPGERNLISGNAWDGIALWSGDSTDNTISGNYIGVDASGTFSIPNGYYGLDVYSGHNLIGGQNASPGGACSGACNLISGNRYGLQVMGDGNAIGGNYIGTDVSGTKAITSTVTGQSNNVQIGSDYNSIGGATPELRNLMTGPVYIAPPYMEPTQNRFSGNYIGVEAGGTTCIAAGHGGIVVYGSEHVIGGHTPAEGNRICGYKGYGIWVNGPGSLVAHNEIYGHGEDGIRVSGATALANTLTHNSIYNNGGLGINLVEGGNTELPAPVILAHDLAAGTASGTACANCTVELYSDEHGEGHWFEADATAGAAGDWSIAKGSPFLGPELTATATDAAGNTSEFGQDWPPDPPPAPTFASPLCGVTNQPALLFSGNAQLGSTVRVGAEGLALGEATTDDRNRWQLLAEAYLTDASYVISATASTTYGTSDGASLALEVDSGLCFDPVGVTFAQLWRTQHPRNAAGCVDPGDDLEIDLWPAEPVTVEIPARISSAVVYVEVNAIRHDLYDPDGDAVFTGSFIPPGSGDVVVLVAADCGPERGVDTMQIGSVIDPDGYVYDGFLAATTGVTHTIEGVTVTLYLSDTVRTKWITWDAELYDQTNPQITGAEGYFSFFTPPGSYKLVADGRPLGYELYESGVLTVVRQPVRHNVGLWPTLERIYLPMVLRQH